MSSAASPSAGSRRHRGAWARELLREVWAETPSIPPGRYCAYNAFVGLILTGLAFAMWIDRWPGIGSTVNAGALGAVPGPVLMGMSYGALQVAEFGPWSRHSKRLRVAGFIAGICGELAFAACVVVYLTRGHP